MNLELATHEPAKDNAVRLVRDFIRAGYQEWPATDGYHYLAVQLSGQIHATVQEHQLDEAIDHYKAYLKAGDVSMSDIADFYEEEAWQPHLSNLYHSDITTNLTEAFNAVLPNRYGIITDADTQDLFNETTTTLRSAA